MSVSLQGVEQRGYEPRIEASSWLELSGALDEPVRDVREVVLSLYTRDNLEPGTARPLAVGSIFKTRPELSVVVGFPHSDFQNIWTLALLERLKFAHFAFTKPYYNSALVTEISFSTEREE